MVNSLIGKTLGKYLIQGPLGSGAMAEVYKAYHPALDRHVAIKFLHSFLA
jgi:serine/threonine-protein kinase